MSILCGPKKGHVKMRTSAQARSYPAGALSKSQACVISAVSAVDLRRRRIGSLAYSRGESRDEFGRCARFSGQMRGGMGGYQRSFALAKVTKSPTGRVTYVKGKSGLRIGNHNEAGYHRESTNQNGGYQYPSNERRTRTLKVPKCRRSACARLHGEDFYTP